MPNRARHRHILKPGKLIAFNNSYAIAGAYPDLSVYVLKSLNIIQRRYIFYILLFELLPELSVIDIRAFCSKIYTSRLLRIRQYGHQSVDTGLITADIAAYLGILYSEKISALSKTVEVSVIAQPYAPHICHVDPIIVYRRDVHIIIDQYDAGSSRNIKPALIILNDASYSVRAESVRLSEHPELALFHKSDAIVIGAYPQPVPAVYIKTDNTGDTCGRIYTFKSVAVISYKSAVASYPDESLTGLGNRVSLRCRKTACVIIKHSRVAFCLPDRVDLNIGIRAACGIRHLDIAF